MVKLSFGMKSNVRLKTTSHGMRYATALAALIFWAAVPAFAQAGGASETAKSITVTDDDRRTVTIPQPVRRIVSLAPSATETLFALGAGDRVVGDTIYCNYPPEAQKKTKVGGPVTPNLEEVVALKPDVVILAANSANREETANALDALHVPAYSTDAPNIQALLGSIQKLGDVIGAGDQAKALTASLQARLNDIHQKLANVTPARVLFVVWRDPLISAGGNTFLTDALRSAGAKPAIETQEDWPRLSMEEVVHEQPDDLIFAAPGHVSALADLADLRAAPGWRDLNAVKEGHVIVLSDAIQMPAPRLVDAIEELARALHPEAFADAPKTNAQRNAAGGMGARR
jgi:iron complex transport system substrate-binding protein